MFAKLNRRDRTALIAGAIAAALFLVLNFAVFPLLDRFARSPEAVEQKELTLRRYQRLLADTGLAKAQHSSTQERLTELEAGLLESPSASLANAEWQRLIGELADSKGIELGSSEFLRTEDVSQDYALMTGRVQFRCRLDQLVDFLAALASSPKLLCVKRLTVSAPQGDPQNRLNVELMVGAATRKTVASVK